MDEEKLKMIKEKIRDEELIEIYKKSTRNISFMHNMCSDCLFLL